MAQYWPKDGELLPESFKENFFEGAYQVVLDVLSLGFDLTLVGGAPRDWLVTGKLPSDLDIELRHRTHFTGEKWEEVISSLYRELKARGHDLEQLSFGIIRVKLTEGELEFSSPRLEEFHSKEALGHSDFSVQLISDLNYNEAFARRDFTLNSIGISVGVDDLFKIIDPFGGIQDLKNRQLVAVSDVFACDPVRLCRLVRFKIKFSAQISEKTKTLLQAMDASKLTRFYFMREGIKAGFFIFAREFFAIAKASQIKLPEDIQKLSFLEGVSVGGESPIDALEGLADLVLRGEVGEEQLAHFAQYFQIGGKTLKALTFFKEGLVKQLEPNGLKRLKDNRFWIKPPVALGFYPELMKAYLALRG
jgi:tRNA nucleotidyltransferase (CCA-adding enzyme)